MDDWIKNNGTDPVEIAKAEEVWRYYLLPMRAVNDLLSGEG
jgi:hypothetical protein